MYVVKPRGAEEDPHSESAQRDLHMPPHPYWQIFSNFSANICTVNTIFSENLYDLHMQITDILIRHCPL